MKSLDERMKEAGMLPVSEMMEQNIAGKFAQHANVTDLKSFENWLVMRRKEYIKMQAEMTLDGKTKDELFEWVVAHNAVFGEVLANFKKATKK